MQEAKESTDTLRILVIDDAEYSRKMITQTLENAGLNVVGEASNALEATEILNHQNANLLIIDVVMPDVSGIELAKYLKDNFRLYVILISSLNQEHIILEAITAGASDFLHKPFNDEDLINSINKIAEEIKQDSSF